MVRERAIQRQAFDAEAKAKGWSPFRKKREWQGRIRDFYSEHKWVVTRDIHHNSISPRINPWSWYDFVFTTLPEELKWDTPRGRRVVQPTVQLDKIHMQKLKAQWFSDLRIAAEREPRRRAAFRQQARDLGLKGRF